MTRALAGLKVAELAGEFGGYCGRLLADLGAEVILVETPSGCALRRRPPFTPRGESVWFTYHHANKRSLVLDPRETEDRRRLASLVSTSDVLLGNGNARWFARWGLDPDELVEDFPQLVITSVTPFGLTGPSRTHEGTDLICMALGGLLSLGGYGDGAPVLAAGEQAITGASTFAAIGTLMAVLAVEGERPGQVVDVSIHETVTMALEHAAQYYDLQGIVRGRQTGRQRGAGAGLYRCADGWIYLFVGGIASGGFWPRFLTWLRESGCEGTDRLTDDRWTDRDFLDSEEAKATFLEVFESFSATRNKEDLTRQAQERGIPVAPVRSVPEVVDSAQLRARDFFQPLTTAAGEEVLAPGAPYRLHATPWHVSAPAPPLGEHDGDLLAQLGRHHG